MMLDDDPFLTADEAMALLERLGRLWPGVAARGGTGSREMDAVIGRLAEAGPVLQLWVMDPVERERRYGWHPPGR